jgi:hypothetical protein
MNIVGEVLEEHFTGILVLDEIQNVLKDAKQRYSNIDFFMTFANQIQVPTMHVGLPSAMGLYPQNMHSMRRATDAGIRLLEPFMSEEEWDLFIEELIRYQWTEQPKTKEEIEDALREKSQKNPCIASRLFELAQAIAIERGMKSITGEHIRSVADERFKLIKPLVDSIRDNKLEDIENASLAVQQMNDLVAAEVASAMARVRLQEKAEHRRASDVLNSAVGHLISLGMPQDEVVTALKTLMTSHPGCDVAFLVREYLVQEAEPNQKARSSLEEKVAKEMKLDQKILNGRKQT